MEPQAPAGVARRGKRRWLRRFAVALLLVPLATFGLSNLILDSEKGRAWLSARIKARTTLDSSIGGASWSPWNGITLRNIRIEQPAPLRGSVPSPLVAVEMLRVHPVWQAAFQGRLDVRRIILERPEIVLPVELVAHFAPPSPPPVIAANRTEPDVSPPAAIVQPPLHPPADFAMSPAPPPAAPTEAPVAEAPAPESSPAPTPPPKPSAPEPDHPTDFIELKNGSFTLVSAGTATSLAEFSGIGGAIPVAGKAAQGSLSIALVRGAGNDLIHDLRLPLDWKAPLLTLTPSETEILGLRAKIAGQLAMVAGIPAAFECSSPEQPARAIPLPDGNRFSPGKASAALRFRGPLLAPAAWQMDAAAIATKPAFTSRERETKFDLGRIVAMLRGGTFSCPDLRLTGDDVSFLGNATVLSDGRAAAVLRVVAPPETGMSVVRKWFPGVTAPPAFSSMSSPQRVALDIEASGTLGDLDIRLGKNGPLVGQETPPASATPK